MGRSGFPIGRLHPETFQHGEMIYELETNISSFLKQFNNQTVNGDQGMDDMLKCL